MIKKTVRLRTALLQISLSALVALQFPAFFPQAGWAQAAAQSQPMVHVTLLQLNDVYQLAPDTPQENGGFARIATLRKRIKAENPNTFMILAGDTISPSPGGKALAGKPMIDLWNQVGLDFATLGNHEFDYGNDVLLQRLSESRFQWVIANVIDHNTGKPFGNLHPYTIQEVNGIKIGFFGVLTPDTKGASSAGPNVEFKDPTYTACATIAKMRREGADVIVAITHLSMDEDKRLARSTQHHVALVMGGHEHTLLESIAGGTPIIKVGSDARTMGRYDLYIDPETHGLQSMDIQLIPVDASIPNDPTIEASMNAYLTQIEANSKAVIGTSKVPLNAVQQDNRTRETNLGNFIADAYRTQLKTNVALLNSGSIRSNKVYPAGNITRKEIQGILQFAGPVYKVQVSGKTLKQALEHGVSRAGEESGRFPQVSGLQFAFDSSQPVGSRVTKVLVGGQPLNESRTYTLAVPGYIAKGGDDYAMLKAAKVIGSPDDAPLDTTLFEEALREAKTISPKIEGRIQQLNAKPQPANKI